MTAAPTIWNHFNGTGRPMLRTSLTRSMTARAGAFARPSNPSSRSISGRTSAPMKPPGSSSCSRAFIVIRAWISSAENQRPGNAYRGPERLFDFSNR